MMMRRDGDKVAGGESTSKFGAAALDDTKASSGNAGIGSNSTIREGVVNISSLSRLITPNPSDGTLRGKERLWTILQTRNVTRVDADYRATIPSTSWSRLSAVPSVPTPPIPPWPSSLSPSSAASPHLSPPPPSPRALPARIPQTRARPPSLVHDQ